MVAGWHGGGVDERRHPPTDDLWWGEAWTFELATPDGRLGAYVRLELLPNQGTCWYWAWVVGPDRAPVVVLDPAVPPPRGESLELRTDGLWVDHIVEEPFEHVSVGAEAFALRLDDPAEAYGPLVGVPTPFGLDLGWETDGDHPAGPDLVRREGGSRQGYSLPCHVVGEILVADERIELDAVGHRHHTWGVEDWWSAGWTAAHGRLDDGTWFSHRSQPSHAPAGTERTTTGGGDGDGDGFPGADRIDVGHPELHLAVEPVAYAPVPVADHDGRRSHLVRALCRFRDHAAGRGGVGWAEWNRPLGETL
jgi:hypothetical protein